MSVLNLANLNKILHDIDAKIKYNGVYTEYTKQKVKPEPLRVFNSD